MEADSKTTPMVTSLPPYCQCNIFIITKLLLFVLLVAFFANIAGFEINITTTTAFVLREVQFLLFSAPCEQPYTFLRAVCVYCTVFLQPDFDLISTLETEKKKNRAGDVTQKSQKLLLIV